MASFNIGQTPMPTNAGIKPVIVPTAVGYFAADNFVSSYTLSENGTNGVPGGGTMPSGGTNIGTTVLATSSFVDPTGTTTSSVVNVVQTTPASSGPGVFTYGAGYGISGPTPVIFTNPTTVLVSDPSTASTSSILTITAREHIYPDTGKSLLTTATSQTETATFTSNNAAVTHSTGWTADTVKPLNSALSAAEGNRVYAVFQFKADATTTSTNTELKDSVAVTYSFDGISADDWVPGSFRMATLNSSGQIASDNQSDTYAASGNGTVAVGGWARVSEDASATSGTINYSDLTPFDPNTGTGVFGVVLSVELKPDSITETGEHVKFKVTQDSASGSAFTQSNYTEANIKVTDGGVGFTTGATTMANSTATFAVTNGTSAAITLATVVSGIDNQRNTFEIGSNTTAASSAWTSTGVTFTTISNFGAEDVLSINYNSLSGASAPGLSLVNFGDVSAAFQNEAYLLTALRSLSGADMNRGGIYMMQTGGGTGTSGSSGIMTYILVDSDRDGKVDTGSGTVAGDNTDLLIRLAGVDVNTLQSTNFLLAA